MSLTKEYFDSIQIDLVKRKYYNANKVHAVFDDIQRQAQELIEENEALRAMLAEREDDTSKTSRDVEKLQQVYRETMERARTRSDALIRETEDSLRRQQTEAQKSKDMASRLLVEAVSMLKQREEENTDFLNRQLQKYISAFDGTVDTEAAFSKEPDFPEDKVTEAIQPLVEQPEEINVPGDPDPEDQEELKRKVKALAQEIHEMENQ